MNVVRRVGAFFFGSRRRVVTSAVWAVVMVGVFTLGYNLWDRVFPPRLFPGYSEPTSVQTQAAFANDIPVNSPAPGTAPQAAPVQAAPQAPYVVQPQGAYAASPAQDTGIPGGQQPQDQQQDVTGSLPPPSHQDVASGGQDVAPPMRTSGPAEYPQVDSAPGPESQQPGHDGGLDFAKQELAYDIQLLQGAQFYLEQDQKFADNASPENSRVFGGLDQMSIEGDRKDIDKYEKAVQDDQMRVDRLTTGR